MRPTTFFLYAGLVGGLTHAPGSTATPSMTGSASLWIIDSQAIQTVSTVRPLSIDRGARRDSSPGSSLPASGIIGISGGAGQVYSIRLSHLTAIRGGTMLENLTAWSDTAGGNVVAGRPLRMSADGRDILRLKGYLHVADGAASDAASDAATASMTLGIDYQ